VLFEHVADEYDAGRPSYPSGVYDALDDLRELDTLDVGAGTGIATRALVARGARVIAVDAGPEILQRAVSHSPDLRAAVADGVELPFRDQQFDLTSFAQSWHWLDPSTRCAEVHRVLRDGGRWAAWWSHARADGEPWFDAHWTLIERTCRGVTRSQRDTDWSVDVAASRCFDVADRVTVPWMREIQVDDWITDVTTHSYVAALDQGERDELIAELRSLADRASANGLMRIPYETWLWIGVRRTR
jgi:SAM-dependent methyltransferase